MPEFRAVRACRAVRRADSLRTVRRDAVRSGDGRGTWGSGYAGGLRVSNAVRQIIGIPAGGRLVFGRGPDADLTIPAGRGPPAGRADRRGDRRRPGCEPQLHPRALHGERRMQDPAPRLEARAEPSGGWFVRVGAVWSLPDDARRRSVAAGSRGQPARRPRRVGDLAPGGGTGHPPTPLRPDSDSDAAPALPGPETKLFCGADVVPAVADRLEQDHTAAHGPG